MLKKVSVVLLAIIFVFATVVWVQPATYTVVRSTTIQASPEVAHSLVNDFHNWDKWSPWAKLDPNMKTEYQGPSSGVGSVYKWTGNNEVGEGEMKILESRPDLVRVDLHFIEPFDAHALNQFQFTPQSDGVKVDWTMSGENNFIGKAYSLFVDMEKTVGEDFEKGLDKLKATAEGR